MKPKVVLLVEDNEDDVDLTLRSFEKSRIVNDVVVARDGMEALEYLFGTPDATRPAGERPSLILLDIKLPRLSGLEVLKRIRAMESTRHLPVVVLTTSKEEKDLI